MNGVGITGVGITGVGITGVGITGVGFVAGRLGFGFGADFFEVGAASGTTASIGASAIAASTIGCSGAVDGEFLNPKRMTTTPMRTANAMQAAKARLIAGS